MSQRTALKSYLVVESYSMLGPASKDSLARPGSCVVVAAVACAGRFPMLRFLGILSSPRGGGMPASRPWIVAVGCSPGWDETHQSKHPMCSMLLLLYIGLVRVGVIYQQMSTPTILEVSIQHASISWSSM